MIRALIVDDSAVEREFLSYILNSEPGITVVATAANGKEAVNLASEKKPDIILMDIDMPVMNGFEATRQIMETAAIPIIIVSASYEPNHVDKSFRALEAGALMIMEKPPGYDHPQHTESVRELLRLLRLMSEVHVVTRRPLKAGRVPSTIASELSVRSSQNGFRLVAIGASTGGPVAVQEILSRLPADFPLPIVVVQHISAGFLHGMVDWLNQQTPLNVKIAQQGEQLVPGNVYLAPDKRQMHITGESELKIQLQPGTPDLKFCPSVGELFRSLNNGLAPNVIGVLLTGMGNDGAAELKQMRTLGGTTIVQAPESCAVFGMPKVAIQLDAARYVLNPIDIAATLTTLIRTQPSNRIGTVSKGIEI